MNKGCDNCRHNGTDWQRDEPCLSCLRIASVDGPAKWEPAQVSVDEPTAEMRRMMDAACVGIGITKVSIDPSTVFTVPRSNTPEAMVTQGVKFDGDKPRMDLLDSYAIEQLAQVLTFGANKYASHNWRKGIAKSRLIAAALRHLFAYLRGEDKDPESGLSHVAHAMCCCMFLLGLEHRAELDDRYKETA